MAAGRRITLAAGRMLLVVVAVILLPVFQLATHDIVSVSGLEEVTWSGCPATFSDANNSRGEAGGGRCECTTFGEIRCQNLMAVPSFGHPPSPSVTWRVVDLSRQRITELPSRAFGNLRTAKLVLSHNRMSIPVFIPKIEARTQFFVFTAGQVSHTQCCTRLP